MNLPWEGGGHRLARLGLWGRGYTRMQSRTITYCKAFMMCRSSTPAALPNVHDITRNRNSNTVTKTVEGVRLKTINYWVLKMFLEENKLPRRYILIKTWKEWHVKYIWFYHNIIWRNWKKHWNTWTLFTLDRTLDCHVQYDQERTVKNNTELLKVSISQFIEQ
jgi:hypothetical protein